MEKMSGCSWARLVPSQQGINEGVVLYFPEPWALCFWSRPRCWPPQWKIKVPLWIESPAQLDSLLFPGLGLNSQFVFPRGGVLMLGEHRVLVPFSSTQTRGCIIPCLVLLVEPMSRVPVSSTSAKLCLTHHLEHLPEEHGVGAGTWKRSGEKELADPGPEHGKLSALGWSRGERRICLKYKSIWDSRFPFGEVCVLSWTAEMLLAVEIAE